MVQPKAKLTSQGNLSGKLYSILFCHGTLLHFDPMLTRMGDRPDFICLTFLTAHHTGL
jgi:hypothetical protein